MTLRKRWFYFVITTSASCAAVFGACYFSIQSERCADALTSTPSCTNDCLQRHSVDPTMYSSYCDSRDDPPTGALECTNRTVVTQMQYRNGTCYTAGSGPRPEITTNYCWFEGIPWNPTTGPACNQAVVNGVCPGGG